MPSEIVVVGAGYAGISAYVGLRRRASHEAFRITLIDERPYHTFTTELHSVAAGFSDADDVTVPLARLVRRPDRLIVDEVAAVNVSDRRVKVADRWIRYDLCLLAVGAMPEDYGIGGVAEYACSLTDVASARDIRRRLSRLGERGYGEVVVVGGGLTGVELAAEVRDVYRDRLAVTVVEAGSDVMAGVDAPLVAASRRLLAEKGVSVRTRTRVEKVLPDRLQLQEGTAGTNAVLPYDLLVWAAGVRGHPLIAQSGLTVNPTGRAYVDAYLRSRDDERVFLTGDCAAFVTGGRTVLPPTAQAAEQAGRHVALNLRRTLAFRPLEAFEPDIRGFFASLGQFEGVGELGREQFIGLPAIVVKRLIEAHHAYEAGGLESLLRHLVRHSGRLLWGEGAALRPRTSPSAAKGDKKVTTAKSRRHTLDV